MKWHNKPHLKRKDTREVTEFLWMPKRIANETKWLETAKYLQLYGTRCDVADLLCPPTYPHPDSIGQYFWQDVKWL